MTVFSKKTVSGILLSMMSLLCLVLLAQCDSSSGPKYDPIMVDGKVVAAQTNAPIQGALVRKLTPPPEQYTITDEEGMFHFEFEVDSTMTFRFEMSKEEEEFITEYREITLVPELDRTLADVRLRKEGETTDDDPEDLPPGVEVGPPANIDMVERSAEFINIKEEGNIEQAIIGYKVTDASGYPVRGAEVSFELGESPGGGERLYPATALTNGDGVARTTLTSGTSSGPVQIIASVDGDGETLRSRSVRISISSGMPHPDFFTLKVEVGGHKMESVDEVEIIALVGDRFGNPVSEGTEIKFFTDGGVIGPGSAKTDNNGRASNTLQYGNPIPPNGFVTVRATTVDENNNKLEASGQILFVSPEIIIDITPETFFIDHLEDQEFHYFVTDGRGNPLAEGTSISVTVDSEGFEVLGDVDVEVGSEVISGPGVTEFQFNVMGTNEEPHANPRPVYITIEVETPNYIARKTITGRKAKPVLDR